MFTEDRVRSPVCGVCSVRGGFLHSKMVPVYQAGHEAAVQLRDLHGVYPG